MFSNLTNLKNITLGNNIEVINYNAFYNCSSLTSIVIPDSVTSIGNSVFQNCTGLTSVTFGNHVQSIGAMTFAFCSGLTNVILPDSLTAIDSVAFMNCSNLATVRIPRSVTTFGGGVFSGCSKLTIYGYTSTAAETYADNNSIPFSLLLRLNTGSGYTDNPLVGTQTRDLADTSFGLSGVSSFGNIELLGVQKKAGDTNDMRFVAVVNEGIISSAAEKNGDIVDYGFVAAKTQYTNTASATDNYISKVELDAENTFSRSCLSTENTFCGDYGKNSVGTKYKYVTLAIEDVPADLGVVVRFYIKTKSGKVYYANYTTGNTAYAGCVTSYNGLSSSIA